MRKSSRDRGGFTLVELLVVIVIIALLAALLLPALTSALCSARQGVTKKLISSLETAASMYNSDFGTYPPGSGSDSKGLASALKTQGPKKQMYYEFRLDDLGPSGNVLNPVFASSGEILYYRNNKANSTGGNPPAGAHKTQSVDIWGKDCHEKEEGISNWE